MCGSNTTTTTSGPPQVYLDAYEDVLGQAQQVAATPLVQYDIGPNAQNVVAPFDPYQLQAFEAIYGLQGGYQPYIDLAQNYFTTAGQPIDVPGYDTLDTYFNPYTEYVTDTLSDLYNAQNAEQYNAARGNAAARGAFGGDREAVLAGEMARQQGLAQNQALAQVQQQGFAQAQQALERQQQMALARGQAERQLALGTGYGLANLGQLYQTLGLGDASALLQAGGLKQAQAQRILNAPYEQFLQRQAYPFQTTGWLANIASGLGGSAGGTASTTYPGPSTASQVLGLGMSGIGLLGQTGAFGSGGWLTGSSGSSGMSYYPGVDVPGFYDPGYYYSADGGRIERGLGGAVPDLSVSPVPGAMGLGTAPPKTAPGMLRQAFTQPVTSTTQKSSSGILGPLMNVAKLGAMFISDGGAVGLAQGGPALPAPPRPAPMMPNTLEQELQAKLERANRLRSENTLDQFPSISRISGFAGYDEGGAVEPPYGLAVPPPDLTRSWVPEAKMSGRSFGPPSPPQVPVRPPDDPLRTGLDALKSVEGLFGKSSRYAEGGGIDPLQFEALVRRYTALPPEVLGGLAQQFPPSTPQGMAARRVLGQRPSMTGYGGLEPLDPREYVEPPAALPLNPPARFADGGSPLDVEKPGIPVATPDGIKMMTDAEYAAYTANAGRLPPVQSIGEPGGPQGADYIFGKTVPRPDPAASYFGGSPAPYETLGLAAPPLASRVLAMSPETRRALSDRNADDIGPASGLGPQYYYDVPPVAFGAGAPSPPPAAGMVTPSQMGAIDASRHDPRGLVPFIRQTAAKYGIDPDTAVRVAMSEGLANPVGDAGKSFGAFQLYTGGGMGNEFVRDTGLDPAKAENEKATIEYALSRARETGWTPFHGAARVGIKPWQGIKSAVGAEEPGPMTAAGAAGESGLAMAPPVPRGTAPQAAAGEKKGGIGNFMSSPWALLTAVGAGMLASQSPHAGVALGEGLKTGLAFGKTQQDAESKAAVAEVRRQATEDKAKNLADRLEEMRLNRARLAEKDAKQTELQQQKLEQQQRLGSENLAVRQQLAEAAAQRAQASVERAASTAEAQRAKAEYDRQMLEIKRMGAGDVALVTRMMNEGTATDTLDAMQKLSALKQSGEIAVLNKMVADGLATDILDAQRKRSALKQSGELAILDRMVRESEAAGEKLTIVDAQRLRAQAKQNPQEFQKSARFASAVDAARKTLEQSIDPNIMRMSGAQKEALARKMAAERYGLELPAPGGAAPAPSAPAKPAAPNAAATAKPPPVPDKLRGVQLKGWSPSQKAFYGVDGKKYDINGNPVE